MPRSCLHDAAFGKYCSLRQISVSFWLPYPTSLLDLPPWSSMKPKIILSLCWKVSGEELRLCASHSIDYLLSHFHNTTVLWKTTCSQPHTRIHVRDSESTVYIARNRCGNVCLIGLCKHLADSLFGVHIVTITQCHLLFAATEPCWELFWSWGIRAMRRKWQRSRWMSNTRHFSPAHSRTRRRWLGGRTVWLGSVWGDIPSPLHSGTGRHVPWRGRWLGASST